jgi:hypothetical protein
LHPEQPAAAAGPWGGGRAWPLASAPKAASQAVSKKSFIEPLFTVPSGMFPT